MQRLLYPRSVVVIGVSTHESNMAKMIVRNLIEHEYPGPAYAVGARSGEVFGQKIHSSLEDVPKGIDLAAILTPAATIPAVLEQCGRRDITRAVIMTAGFSEYGAQRSSLEQEILAVADRFGIRFLGPNCVGLMNSALNLYAVFMPVPKGSVLRGPVSVLAQSGSVAMFSASALTREAVGVSKVVSLGNKLNIDEVDLLEYLEGDEDTAVTCMYLESTARGRALYDLAGRCHKPIVVQKAGVGKLGHQTARSHTAALASDDAIVDAALRQAGAIRVRRLSDFYAAAKALLLPPMRGDNVAMVGASGGMSVTAADACDAHGLHLPAFPQEMLDDIEQLSPEKVIRRGNPLDFGDMFDNNVFMHAIERAAKLPEVDGLVLAPRRVSDFGQIGPDKVETMRNIRDLCTSTGKPIAVTFGVALSPEQGAPREVSFPIFEFGEDCVAALALLREYARRQEKKGEGEAALRADRSRAAALLARHAAAGRGYLGDEALAVIEAYGVPVAPAYVAHSVEDAVAAGATLGYPLVLKVRSPDIVHKSDVGGVVVGIASPGELRDSYRDLMTRVRERLPEARIEGVLLQRMVREGREMILGGKRDPQFGPVVMLGLGGVYVETLGDVAIRLAPLGRGQAADMLGELRGAKLLEGVRGEAPADVDALLDCVLRVGRLMADFPQIAELDVNPLKVLDKSRGAVAVDARIVLS